MWFSEISSAKRTIAASSALASVTEPASANRARSSGQPFIVLAEGHTGSDELVAEIQTHVRNRLSAYAYPRRIEFVEQSCEVPSA